MQIPVRNNNLPSGFCPPNYQAMLNGFTTAQYVDLETAGNRIITSSTPPTDTSVIWLQLDSFGRPVRYYFFAQGAWLSLHPIVTGLTQWWFDAAPDFATFDGGDSQPPSDISGPMWQLAKNNDGVVIAAKFPIVAGTLPDTTTVLIPGATGGVQTQTLGPTNIPAGVPTQVDAKSTGAKISQSGGGSVAGIAYFTGSGDDGGNLTVVTKASGPPDGSGNATVVPFSVLPVYVVGVLLQRTGKLFYVVN